MIPDTSGPTSRIYFSQRLRLHYVDWGNAGAPPLLLLHGGRDHCRSWDWVAAALRRDWHVLAPDLRGHGDSQWSANGDYAMTGYVYDLAQLIHQQELAPATIIAHSLGGMIALRYAGIYPERVRRLVAIEGLGPSPRRQRDRARQPVAERLQHWIAAQRGLAGRLPRRYARLEEAFQRMREANAHLSPEQAWHLTQYGVNQNEDGTYSWKFDNYVRLEPPCDLTSAEIEELWGRITCPTLLVYGQESRVSNPQEDGRVRHFRNARVVTLAGAGHWVHHDRLDAFLELLRGFL
jgi:pimeloyl-ACP methyl ester carboxylesterase